MQIVRLSIRSVSTRREGIGTSNSTEIISIARALLTALFIAGQKGQILVHKDQQKFRIDITQCF